MIFSVITLFEHDTIEFAWTDRDLVALASVNRALGVDVLRATVGRGGQRQLQAAQHVGVVRLGACTFQILPKMYRPDADGDRIQESTRNLLSLLAYAGQLTIREHALAPLLRQNADWFELLTRLFASHLRDEWQRGVIRGYQARDEDSPTLRGKWRVGDRAFNTKDGQKALADLSKKNGLALDGTPIIKTTSDIANLVSKGFVTLQTRNDGLRYAVCPEIRDSHNGGIAPDAFLNTARKPDGSRLAPAFVSNFLSLQQTGDWAHYQ